MEDATMAVEIQGTPCDEVGERKDDPTLAGGDANEGTLAEALSTAIKENEDNPFLKCLEMKDLVTEKVLSFLNFEDMKTLSEVSKAALGFVRRTVIFSKKARLRICREVIQNGMLKESTYLWKHIMLDLSIPMEILDVIRDMLEVAESIYLELSPNHPPAMNIAVGRYVEEVLKITKCLLTLGLNGSIMTLTLHDVFSNVEIQTVFGKLDTLDIYGSKKPSLCPFYIGSCNLEDSTDDIDVEDRLPFQRNLFQLSSVPLNLKKFVFGRFHTGGGGSDLEYVKYIPGIVDSIKDVVEELELNFHVWNFEEMKGIRCPKLKTLIISTAGDCDNTGKIVDTFLKNQPPLEELTLAIKNEFPASILITLQGKGVLAKMKKLHIKAKRFVGSTGPVDWQFLETMPNLKDFSIRKAYSKSDFSEELYGYGEDFLKKLPIQTERICLQGFSEFWRPSVEDQASEKNIGSLLKRFKNLTELNVLRSYGSVTDIGLQSIISECPKLNTLVFSHCPDLTDFGLSGTVVQEGGENEQSHSEKTGVSLDELKNLQHLKIRSCPNVTPGCLLNVVKFPYLESFDYYRNVELDKDFLCQIAQQNRCLEKVALHLKSYDQDAEYLNTLKEELKKSNRRLHNLELLEKSDWEDVDSDSDTSSVEGLDNDSDFSFGGNLDYDDDYGFSPEEFDEVDDYDYDDYDGLEIF